ncbi:MAG: hypothetical protein ACI4CT_07930 [Lachnospiraceae bacterium]
MIDICRDWKKCGSLCWEYPGKTGIEGFEDYGFEQIHHGSMSMYGKYGFYIEFDAIEDETEFDIMVGFVTGRDRHAKVALSGKGRKQCYVSLEEFNVELANKNIWRFVTKLAIEIRQGHVEIHQIEVMDARSFLVSCEKKGQTAGRNETVQYEVHLENLTEQPQRILVKQIFYGWESLKAEFDTSNIYLEPYEKKICHFSMQLSDRIVPGGREKTELRFVVNGDSTSTQTLEVITTCRKEHPYLYHDETEWEEVRKRIQTFPVFQNEVEKYREIAEEWVVEKPLPASVRYCYDTAVEKQVVITAYMYAITKEIRYAQKVAAWFRYYSDKEMGYPAKLRGCSQAYVQEGGFTHNILIAYDIIYDSGVLTDEDKDNMEHCIRLYMDMLDYHLLDGNISNWNLAELSGAVFGALVLQDGERLERFVYGPCGVVDQMRYGYFPDGWWHECSVGYNTWVSSLLLHMGHVLLKFGIDILYRRFEVPYNLEVHSTYGCEEYQPRFAMENKRRGNNDKTTFYLKDAFDAVLPFIDYRGVIFGINDSSETKINSIALASTYELAYRYYHDERYIPLIRQMSIVDPVFGFDASELEDLMPTDTPYHSAYSDNIGVAMLRSQAKGRNKREQLQIVLRYGSHGGAHGHFDTTNLLSIMRYGKSLYNPECVWWSYLHFMYKFYVQNSITKNMVNVDGKMQLPADSKRTMFVTGEDYQAVGISIKTPWAYPPYGGMQYKDGETLAERSHWNACSLPEVTDAPEYGTVTEATEEILQNRVLVVRDDYFVVFDYVAGEQEHQYDLLYQWKGLKEITADSIFYQGQTSCMTDQRLSDNQFVTDCHWYDVRGVSKASFEMVFGEKADMRGTRSNFNEDGVLKTDIYVTWPPENVQMTGQMAERFAEPWDYDAPYTNVTVLIETDGIVADEKSFGAWHVNQYDAKIALENVKSLRLRVRQHPTVSEFGEEIRAAQCLHWGRANIYFEDGTVKRLDELAISYHNVDTGYGTGRDYENGRVVIAGEEYPYALPASPINHDMEAVIEVNLSGLPGAVRFEGIFGANVFPGDESQRRKTYAIRTNARAAHFVSVLEVYEEKPMVSEVKAVSPQTVEVHLRDGRTEVISVEGIEGENPKVVYHSFEGA